MILTWIILLSRNYTFLTEIIHKLMQKDWHTENA